MDNACCSLLAKKIVFENMLLVIMVLRRFYCSLFAHLLLTVCLCAMRHEFMYVVCFAVFFAPSMERIVLPGLLWCKVREGEKCGQKEIP